MPAEFSLAHLTVLGLSPPAMIRAAARAGYSYVGLRLNAVTESEPKYSLHHDTRLLEETRRELAASGLQVLDVELIRLTPDFDVSNYDSLLDTCATMGARHLLVQGADSQMQRLTHHFGMLCEAAAKRNLTADIEFVTWTQIADLTSAARVVAAVAQPNAGLLVDTLHFSRSNCDISELAQLPRSWFRFAQVCDAPAESPATVDGLIHAARQERMFLGDGGLNIRGILNALPSDIPYSLEIPNTSLAARVGLEECARLALQTAKEFFAANAL